MFQHRSRYCLIQKHWHTSFILYSLFACIAFLRAHEKSWRCNPQALQGSLALLAYFFPGMQLEEIYLNETSLPGNQGVSTWLLCPYRDLVCNIHMLIISDFIVAKLSYNKFSIDPSETCIETLTNSWQFSTGNYYFRSINCPILNQFNACLIDTVGR